MLGSRPLGKSSLCLLLAVLCGIGQGASAHSVLMIPGGAVIEASVVARYRFQHACEDSGRPVIAQSFVLPALNPHIVPPEGVTIPDANGSGGVDLGDIIQSASLTGLITPYIDASVFKNRQLKIDDPSLGNPIGFSSTKGKIPSKYYAEIPLLLTPVFFVDTSCVTQLVVHPVGADICKVTKNVKLGDANIWMEHPTKKFPNPVHGTGENELRIVYQRDLNSTPLPNGCGEGHAVDVFASDEDIDKNLPIPGYWPK